MSIQKRFLRDHKIFEKFSQKKYLIWTDAGPHFRCKELMHYFFKELADQKVQVSFNLFCEGHGKAARDSHFSIIDNFIKQESLQKKLCSTEDVILAIIKGQKQSNLRREKLGLDPIITVALEYRPNSFDHLSFYKKIFNLKSYYNFFTNENFELRSVVYSDLKKSFPIKFKDSQFEIKKRTEKNSLIETKVKTIEANVDKLVNKQKKISNIFDSQNTEVKIVSEIKVFNFLIVSEFKKNNKNSIQISEFEKKIITI